MKIKWSEISSGTIARTIFLIISLINGAAGIFGFTKLDIDENTIYTVVSGIAVIVSSLIAFWKNNSFTEEAILGDGLKNAYKNSEETETVSDDIDEYELENVVNETLEQDNIE